MEQSLPCRALERGACRRDTLTKTRGPYRRSGGLAAAAHFLEQYFTRSQSRSHFFLHANSRLQWAQGFLGK